MFCSAVPIRDTHKSPKIVCRLRTPSAECSKLGKTWIIEDVKSGMLRNSVFGDWILHACFHLEYGCSSGLR